MHIEKNKQGKFVALDEGDSLDAETIVRLGLTERAVVRHEPPDTHPGIRIRGLESQGMVDGKVLWYFIRVYPRRDGPLANI